MTGILEELKWETLQKRRKDNRLILLYKGLKGKARIPTDGPPGVLGIWGEGLFIFRELGSTANYFRGAGEQAHTFGDLGSTAKK